MSSFRPVINGNSTEINNGPSLRFSLQNDAGIKGLASQVINHLRINFRCLNEFLQQLEPIHVFYVENMTVDVAELAQETGQLKSTNQENQENQIVFCSRSFNIADIIGEIPFTN